ncbi:MAG TPA: polysaccharide deacetylase family protein [Thermoanaerobaculia bacterium]|nr:polysaccharide deacetylase family protein [Thermoanaerobaculia bacterium]
MATVLGFLFSIPAFAHEPIETGDPAGAMVLCYHIVEAPLDPRMEISREAFRQQMSYLEMTGYNVIPLRRLYEYITGERASLPPNAVVITIDDGWRSAYTEAYPELKKRGFPFTLFVYPNIVDKATIALTWREIKEMSENGGDIESHSFSHPFLTRRRHTSMDDRLYNAWLQHELLDSKRLLEEHTGRPVKFLAYPYGDFDHVLKAAVKKAGYTAALTCEFGKVFPGSDPLRMRRFVIDKAMDFAAFRHFMGATPMELADVNPKPGEVNEPTVTTVSARIPNFKRLDPHSVGMALLGSNTLLPYAYDAQTGSITLVINDALNQLKGTYHRAVVWAKDAKTGRRVEASWSFRLPEYKLPAAQPVMTSPAQIIPAPAPRRAAPSTEINAVSGGAVLVTPKR